MTISETIWLASKWLLLIAAGSGLLFGLIALFHPLRFNLNLRGSLRGQRAELWFVYLFRIFKIGIIATPHTQDVVVKFLFWQRLLQRNQRQRPRPPATPPPEFPGPTKTYDQPPQSDSSIDKDSAPAGQAKNEAEDPLKAETPEVLSAEEMSAEVVSAEVVPAEVVPAEEVPAEMAPTPPQTVSQASEAAIKDTEENEPAESEVEKHFETESEKKSSRPEPPAEERIAAIEDVDPFADKAESEHKKTTETAKDKTEAADTWQKRLRLLRKRIGEKYRLAKKWLRLIGRKYRLLSPIFWKFWGRSKKGFRVDHPALLCRYALHEPYLTGMFQGNLAIFSGMLQRFGIEFVPVPTFAAPTLYTRGKVSLVLLPWRFVYALICLLFERILWSEAWRLFKWYRSTKTVSNP